MSAPQPQPEATAIVIGASAGGLTALRRILTHLPAGFPLRVVIVSHVAPDSDSTRLKILESSCPLPVREPEDKEPVEPGVVFMAPPRYHLLIELDGCFSYSRDEPVQYCRPSIDVLFETAAETYGAGLTGVILTGANADGSMGLKAVREYGGCAVVQDPATAETPVMPQSALDTAGADHVLALEEIGPYLASLARGKEKV